MDRKSFLSHFELAADPFQDEEAKNDAVFGKLISRYDVHPHFGKVYGDPTRPGPAIVFGPKGSGKTALRMQVEHRIAEHNASQGRRVLVVPYDDLNPLLDCFKWKVGGGRESDDEVLQRLTLSDHMDGILAVAVSGVVGEIIEGSSPAAKAARRLDKQHRATLALLALLYDARSGHDPERRWAQLWGRLRPVWFPPVAIAKWTGLPLAVFAIGGLILRAFMTISAVPLYAALAASMALLGFFAFRQMQAWGLARKIHQGIRVVERRGGTLRAGLARMPRGAVDAVLVPLPGNEESRYQLTRQLLAILDQLGYATMLVLVDRIDEPTLVNSNINRMRRVVWPMLDLKFLQQDRVAVKMLLPAELQHLADGESAEFKQRARLDKCNRITLDWGGSALYDLCTQRMRVCRADGGAIEPRNLFEEQVTREELSSAFGSLIHPRNTLKFMYDLIDAQCEVADRDGIPIPRHRIEEHLKRVVKNIRAEMLMGNPV